MTAAQLIALAVIVGIASVCWCYSSAMRRLTGARAIVGQRCSCAGCSQLVQTFRRHVDQMLAMFDDHERIEQPARDRWERLIDPDSPEYNALAEWAHNIHPSLRKDHRT